MAAALEETIATIRGYQREARASNNPVRPSLADDRAALAEGLDRAARDQGAQGEGSWRSHQVPFSDVRDNPAPRAAGRLAAQLPAEELFDATARSCPSSRRWRRAGRGA
jgi:xylulose-5-phosphate/fructose-6-phosphate phosphoketolase